MDIAQLETKTLSELRNMSRDFGIARYSRKKKDELVLELLKANAERQGFTFGGGPSLRQTLLASRTSSRYPARLWALHVLFNSWSVTLREGMGTKDTAYCSSLCGCRQ